MPDVPEPYKKDSQDENLEVEHGDRNIVRLIRDSLLKLGIPGLLIYNTLKATSVGGTAYLLKGGETSEKLTTGLIVGGVTVISSTTFWIAMGMIATRVRIKILTRNKKQSN